MMVLESYSLLVSFKCKRFPACILSCLGTCEFHQGGRIITFQADIFWTHISTNHDLRSSSGGPVF